MYRDAQGKFIKNGDAKLDGLIAIGHFAVDEIESLQKYTNSIVFIDSSPSDLDFYSIVPNYHMAVGTVLTRLTNLIMSKLMKENNFLPVVSQEGLEIVTRGDEKQKIKMYMNHNACEINYEGLTLAPYACVIVEE